MGSEQSALLANASGSPPLNDLNEVYVPSEYDSCNLVLENICIHIKRFPPSFIYESAPHRKIKCIGKFENTICSSIADNKRKAKSLASLSFINLIIQDERYSLLAKDLLRRNFSAKFAKVELKDKLSVNALLDKKLEDNTLRENAQEEKSNKEVIEAHIFKWERSRIIDEDTMINLDLFKSIISRMLLKYKMKKGKSVNYREIGSMITSTLRNDHIHLDFMITVDYISDLVYKEFIDCVYNDISKNNYYIESIADNQQYITISSNCFKCSIRFVLLSHSKVFINHSSYVSKQKITIDDIILIKVIKAWRRANSLLFLQPEIIEYLILNQNPFQSAFLVDRLLDCFKALSDIKELNRKWNHLSLMVSELIANKANMEALMKAVTQTIDMIKKNDCNAL